MAAGKVTLFPINLGPPPVSKADALSPYTSDDGDKALNALVGPESHLNPYEKANRDYELDRQRQIAVIQDQECRETRDFCVDLVNFTGHGQQEEPEDQDE